MKIHHILVLCLLLCLTACAGKPLSMNHLPSPDEVRMALDQSSPERKVSALKELRETAWPPERRLDLQTLTTYYSLEVVPLTGIERQTFQTEVDILATMVREMPLHKIPEEAGVLLNLANQGYPRNVSSKTANFIDKACTEDKSLTGSHNKSVSEHAADAADRAFGASCFHFVRGDLEGSNLALSRALRFELNNKSRRENLLTDITPSMSAGFDVFKKRLTKLTGVRLDAGVDRLLR